MNTKLLLLGTLIAASSVLIGSIGCGDDDSDDASGGTGATGATSSGTGASGNTGNEGGNPSGGGMPSTGGGGSTGEGGSGGGGVSAECATYCTTIGANCTDDNDQWGDTEMGMCEAVCATWAMGMMGDDMGNTVACHQYHAEASEAAPADHCSHAGPTGDGFCGDLCDNFCELALEVCPAEFADDAACMTACEGFSKMVDYNAGTQGGDSYACRMYHLTAAAVNPATHCEHIGTDSSTCM